MSSLALMEVQRALYTKLSGDGVLMGMVTGIYDVVPQKTATPYVVLGNGAQRLRPADELVVTQCDLELQVWTEADGRKTALAIMNRLHALLHLGTLTLTGFQLVTLSVDHATTSLAVQGTLISGTLTVSLSVVEA